MAHPLIDRLTRRIERATAVTCRDAIYEAQQLTGNAYPPPSAPGQPPHRRSGQVNQSFTYVVTVEGTKVDGRVTNHAPHWKYLAAGTKRMAARPVFTPEFRQKFRRKLMERVRAERTAHGSR